MLSTNESNNLRPTDETSHKMADPALNDTSLNNTTDTFRHCDWSNLLKAQNATSEWPELVVQDFNLAIRRHSAVFDFLPLISQAHSNFQELLSRYKIPISESRIHSSQDLIVQSFALMLSSKVPKLSSAVMAYGTHFLDDKIDPPEQTSNRMIFSECRKDIKKFFENWGELGKLGVELEKYTSWPAGYYHGIHRMFYGGLITNSSASDQLTLLTEYKELSEKNFSNKFRSFIKNIRPICYSLTNKTVCETVPLEGSELDFEAAEVRSISFAPALLFIDLPSEVKNGELRYFGEAPSLDELVNMINTAGNLLDITKMNFNLFLNQLTFVVEAFSRMLPEDIQAAYYELTDRIKLKINH